MTLKKKIEIAVILCSIGICSFGQNVFAGEFLRLPVQTNAKVEQVVQTRLLEEQRAYLMQAQLMTKVNLEQQIKDSLNQVAQLANCQLIADINNDTVLLQSGLDSLGFAMLVAQLEEDLGIDPFSQMQIAVYPRTFGEFVSIYQQALEV